MAQDLQRLLGLDRTDLTPSEELLREVIAHDPPADVILTLHTRMRRWLYAGVPRAIHKLLLKIENHKEPGDTRALVAYLKGMGMFPEAKPEDESDRASALTGRDLGAMTPDEIKRFITSGGKTQE